MEILTGILIGLVVSIAVGLVYWLKTRKTDRVENHLEKTKEILKLEFENIANRLFEQKSTQFTRTNETAINTILTPLKEDIKNFKTRIETIYSDDTKERSSLKTEIKNLMEFSSKVSKQADELTNALKGESKTQGLWGEVQLELLLENSGLQKELHYNLQPSFKDEKGNILRPDCIINLPGGKNIVVDCKVSLTAYERYFNEKDETQKSLRLKEHLESINSHIRDLSSKNYQSLYRINSPDYVLMFFPLESALVLAMKQDISISEKALSRNIALVSGSTMMTVLKTVNHIWKQENQKKYALEIARQSGSLYDKFVAFLEDLKEVGTKIDNAKSANENALNKLYISTKKGDTIIGRIETLKKLGAKATKSIEKEDIEKSLPKPD